MGDWYELEEKDTQESYFMREGEEWLLLYIGKGEANGKRITITASSHSNPSLSISHTVTVCDPRIATSVKLNYDDTKKYIMPGERIPISAQIYNLKNEEIDDQVIWSVTGATNFNNNQDPEKLPTKEQTYFDKNESFNGEKIGLHIGENEPNGTRITVTATSKSEKNVSSSFTITVLKGILLDVNYSDGSAHLRSNGGDSFLFLEVCKKEKDPKGKGTVYCYEGNDISLDLSFMKLSKPVYVYVYGDVNTDPISYTIAAQPKKGSVKFKYVPGKEFANHFTLKEAKIDELEYRRQNETSWKPLSDLEEELDQLMVAGANLLVRQSGMDTKEKKNMPGTEIKLKIPAAPKAPKIKLNYAKNTITLAKNSEVRVPGWEVFSNKPNANGEYEKVPFYYSLGDTKDKEKLNPSPADLAETLFNEYVAAYDKSIVEPNKNGANESTLTDKNKEKLLNELKDGYTLLVRTSDSKKGNSQPAFVEVKEAPVIGIKPKTVSGTAVVAVVTKNEKGETSYGNDNVTIKYDKDKSDKEIIKLTASSDNLFAYSLDEGKKFTKIKKSGTTIKLDKITSANIIIRMEGAEDKKKPENSRWASNEVPIPKTEK